MNKLSKIIATSSLALASALTSCAQEKQGGGNENKTVPNYNKVAIKLNDSASNIQMKVMGNEIPKDSLVQAELLYKRAIQTDPEYKIAYYNLWGVYNLQKKFDSSIVVCSKWLDKHPSDQDFRLKRGMLYELTGKTSLSMIDYKVISEYLNSATLPAIAKDMSAADLEKVISRAHNIYVVDKSNVKPIEILAKLNELFPGNRVVARSYKIISANNRGDYIDSIFGIN